MKTNEALNKMIENSGKSRRQVSADIGRHPNFLTVTLQKKSVPQIDTMAALADAMGYELILRGHGEEIVIDPPSAE